MSLLNFANEDIIIYHEVVDTDTDGNVLTRPSDTGIPAQAMIQIVAQSGTSARRAEQDNEGFETEEVYRMRLRRYDTQPLIGAQARIQWRGDYWAVVGKPQFYRGSSRTAHTDYRIRRT